jgi:cytosine/adenosine deaminase-related metal-dependent hydrolase
MYKIIYMTSHELHQPRVYDPLSTLVYASSAHDVQTVICNGEVKLHNGVLRCANRVLEEVYQKCAEYQEKIRQRLIV